MADVWTPQTPWFGPDKKTEKVWPRYVCRRAGCPSRGKSHPGCKCGIPSIRSQYKNLEYDARGGLAGRYLHEEHGVHDPECPHYAAGAQIQANNEFEDNPDLAIDHAIVSHGLVHALTRSGHSKSENAHRPTEDFLDHSYRGRKSNHSHLENHFDSKHEHPTIRKGETAELRKYLDSVRENPATLLETGSLPGFPVHSAALGARAAMATSYLDGLKPKESQGGPLDPVMPADKMKEQAYERQLGIAERPLSILTHVRDGTLLPADMQTLSTLYPQLLKSIQNKAFESLVNAKTKGDKISYRHKQGLSMLLGQPLDATMTPQAMQAIMHANAGAQVESQGMPNKQTKEGATAATQKTINKNADMYKTQLEKIQTGK